MTVAGAVALGLLGRTIGLDELTVIAAGALMIAVGALIAVQRARIGFEIGRSVRPVRVPAGGSTTVSLRLRNTSGRRSPVFTLTDPIARRGAGHVDAGPDATARLEVASVPSGATRELSYRLPTPHRGIVVIGPLDLAYTDPFGLFSASLKTRSASEVIVLPRIFELTGLPPATGEQPEAGPLLHDVVVSANEEFAALREYAPGDDVRRVHWATTARLGFPIVRHYEEPWQHRTTVLLDVRRAHHDLDSFERAISVAASVLELCASREELVRLVTTGGDDSGLLSLRSEIDNAISRLAAQSPHGAGSLTGASQHLLRRSAGGTLVSVTGVLAGAEASTLELTGSRFGAHVAVTCSPTPPAATAPLVGRRTVSVAYGDGDDLASNWERAVARLAAPTRRVGV